MSQVLIGNYLSELAKLRQIGGTHRESVVREAFKDLLKEWAKQYDLTFIPEYELETKTKERRYVDGALLHTLRVPFGYWEAKDERDDIDTEIELKFRRGYPKTNIIFEDSTRAVLIQHGLEVMRCSVEDVLQLEKLLTLFFDYERPEIQAFRKAVEQFKADLPAVLEALRSMIERAYGGNAGFRQAAGKFLEHAREAINPSLLESDVREMLIQHVLTGEVFAAIFPGQPFHEDNNVVRELHKLESTFFVANTRYIALKGLEPYYAAIRRAASEISTHHEKQTFLKAIYENFYKVYNPKAADRLGVVYTPNEIVRFIIEGSDWLCHRHFRRTLIDRDVDILDPATGTGTFICELISHFAGQKQKLERKYRGELHANEVAILPYYVANLNIEATYAEVMGTYEEFPGLCFVDTLDNTHALRRHRGHMDDMFGAVTDDNVKRIRQQNSRTISVILGNPPYNANQLNENENNKNRGYPEIDKRIKATYISESNARKTKLYDMYVRFFRWASDRLDENGILAFVSNRSFIDRPTFDGFRKVISKEFSEVYILDLGGDVRANPKLSGTTHNVFGIQTGVAISFMVRRPKQKGCRIYYSRRPEMERKEEKLAFLGATKLGDIEFDEITPDRNGNWLNQANEEFEANIPLASKQVRGQKKGAEKAIFKLYSLGASTNRDEWVYDRSADALAKKVKYLIHAFDSQNPKDEFGQQIKWSRNLKRRFKQGRRETFSSVRIVRASYRPYCKRYLYDSDLFIDEGGSKDEIFPLGERNRAICFSDVGSRTEYVVLAIDGLADLHFGSSIDAYQQVPEFRFQDGQRVENVSDWALTQFRKRYEGAERKDRKLVNKEAIFYYVYGILHDPVYRENYAQDLKREFPRIPFYPDFWPWVEWGKDLMALHTDYEQARRFPLERVEGNAGINSHCILRADPKEKCIVVDSNTTLRGIPELAWQYRLGSRAALEWILDQFQERRARDPIIRERFDSYRFAEHKEVVIQLLERVVTVGVETARITGHMRSAKH